MLRSLTDGLIADGDVFALQSTGPSGQSVGLGSDRALLDAAIGRVSGNGLKLAEILVDRTQTHARREIDYRCEVSVSAALRMLAQMPAWPGRRRGMLYVTSGYDADRQQERLSRIARAARGSNVRVFVIDPRTMPGVPTTLSDDAVRNAAARAGQEAIAAGTGGFVVTELVHLPAAIDRINRAMPR